MAKLSNIRRRSAFTLIELLVVISILMLFAATAIPRIAPAFKDRKVREVSRQLSAYFAGAKARAAERGTSVGVVFQRSANSSDECLEVFMAEPRPYYAGDFVGSVARITLLPASMSDPNPHWVVTFCDDSGNNTSKNALDNLNILDGQLIYVRFDYRNTIYVLQANSTLKAKLTPPSVTTTYEFTKWDPTTSKYIPIYVAADAPAFAVSGVSNGLPFQIQIPEDNITSGSNLPKNPIKIGVQPLDIPSGVAIDLARSGLGTSGVEFASSTAGTYPVMILFAPTGEVSGVYYGGSSQSLAAGKIHFLIGSNATTTSTSNSTSAIQDNSSLWISVGTRTGSITTAENFYNPSWGTSPPSGYLSTSRQYAISGQTKGGG